LPLFLVIWAVEAHVSLKIRQQEIETQRSLNAALYKLEPFSDDRRFFHVFLQEKFIRAQQTGGAKSFRTEVKKIFGSRLRLIIWDANGNVDQKLSDELKFRYLMQKMWQAIRAIYLEQTKEEPSLPQHIKEIGANIELFRRYFGQFLTSEVMARPLQSGLNGEALFVSDTEDNGMVWYQFGENFSAACILPKSLKGHNIGLENICRQINTNNNVKTGFYSLKDEKLFAPWLEKDHHSEFLIELQKFSDANFDMQKGKNYLWYFQQANPDIFIFSALAKKHILQREEELLRSGFNIAKILLLAIFVIFCASLRFNMTFSIRLRFILIFSFSSGLPLILLLSSCYEYFHFQKSNLIFAQHNLANNLMREFDSRFINFQNNLAQELNDLVDLYESKYKKDVWPENTLREFEQELSAYHASEYILAKPEEGFYFGGGKKADENSYKNIALTFSSILAAMNKSAKVSSSYTDLDFGGFAGEFDLTTGILDDFGKISNRTLKTGRRMVYMNFLGQRDQNRAWAMLVISWEPQSLQNIFIADELNKFNQEFAPGKLFSIANSGRPSDLSAGNFPKQLQELFVRTRKDKFAFADQVMLNGQSHIVTGMSAYHLNDKTLIAIYPDQPLFARIYRLATQIIFAVLIVAMILLLTVLRFSGGMLQPLRQIENGLLEIQNRNFRSRLSIDDGSEFGELAQAFNTAIESMGDLSLGTSVQAALLPPPTNVYEDFEIHSEVKYMTSMGGDFCDYYHNGSKVHVAFGDVAGHGIPAALIMAMIKAYLPENDLAPGKFLEDCNKIFLYLREKKWRRMMTLASLQVCLKTGHAVLGNAGHCFPILINSEHGTAKFIEAKGIPLGSKHANNFVETSFKLQPGEKILFYSDGFIEDVNEKEESFGYERFLQLIVDNAEKSPTEILETALASNRNWALEQNDDLSLLCFYFKKKNAQNN
jgi:serine phosphatase RsbU (regulator of sigma subunit)